MEAFFLEQLPEKSCLRNSYTDKSGLFRSEHFSRLTIQNDFPVIHNDNAISIMGSQIQSMLNKYNRDSQFLVEFVNDFEYFSGAQRVEKRRRLIEHHYVGSHCEHAAYGYALLLST